MLPLEVIKNKSLVVMKDKCQYDTNTDIANEATRADKPQMLELHIKLMHVIPPRVPPAAAAERAEKFPRLKCTRRLGSTSSTVVGVIRHS